MSICILCGSIKDNDNDHIRVSYIDRQGILDSGYYKPHLNIDEKYEIKRHIGHGEFHICSNRTQCRQRQKMNAHADECLITNNLIQQ